MYKLLLLSFLSNLGKTFPAAPVLDALVVVSLVKSPIAWVTPSVSCALYVNVLSSTIEATVNDPLNPLLNTPVEVPLASLSSQFLTNIL